MIAATASSTILAKDIVHDAEYYLIEAQNGKRWKSDDQKIDGLHAEYRKKNDGSPPDIVYILLDDVVCGQIGMPGQDVISGYSTPNLNQLAQSGMSLQRMYTEPCCTPTRVA